jgi:hypothetical protein
MRSLIIFRWCWGLCKHTCSCRHTSVELDIRNLEEKYYGFRFMIVDSLMQCVSWPGLPRRLLA